MAVKPAPGELPARSGSATYPHDRFSVNVNSCQAQRAVTPAQCGSSRRVAQDAHAA